MEPKPTLIEPVVRIPTSLSCEKSETSVSNELVRERPSAMSSSESAGKVCSSVVLVIPSVLCCAVGGDGSGNWST